MKASKIRNNKLNNKKKSKKKKQTAGSLSDVLASTLLDDYTSKFQKSIEEVYGFYDDKSRFSVEDKTILTEMFKKEATIKKARDELIEKAIGAEKNMSIVTIATHGRLKNAALLKVPPNIILCIRSYYGKIGFFDYIKEDKKHTDIWNTMGFEEKKRYFTKNIKLTTDVKNDTQDDIMKNEKGEQIKFINCSRYASWYYPTQNYYDIDLSINEKTSEKLVQSKNSFSILLSNKTKLAGDDIKIDPDEKITIGGHEIPVQKIEIGTNIRYIFNNDVRVEFTLSQVLDWINNNVTNQVLVICECCLQLTKSEEDYKLLTYNFITQAFNDKMEEYSVPVSDPPTQKQICLNPRSEVISYSYTPEKMYMLFDEHYFTQYNPLLSPYIIKFGNFIDNYLLKHNFPVFSEDNNKELRYFIQALDGVTIGLFSLTLNVLDKLYEENSDDNQVKIKQVIDTIQAHANSNYFNALKPNSYSDFFKYNSTALVDSNSIFVSKYVIYLKVLKRLGLTPKFKLNINLNSVTSSGIPNLSKAKDASTIDGSKVRYINITCEEYTRNKQKIDPILTNTKLVCFTLRISEVSQDINIANLQTSQIPVIHIVGPEDSKSDLSNKKKLTLTVEESNYPINIYLSNINFTDDDMSQITAKINKISYTDCFGIISNEKIINKMTNTFTAFKHITNNIGYSNEDGSIILSKHPGLYDLEMKKCFFDKSPNILSGANAISSLKITECYFNESPEALFQEINVNIFKEVVFRHNTTKDSEGKIQIGLDMPIKTLMGLIFTYKKALLSHIKNSQGKTDILNMDLKTTLTHDLSITKGKLPGKIEKINFIEDVTLDISIGSGVVHCDIESYMHIYKDIFVEVDLRRKLKFITCTISGSGDVDFFTEYADYVNNICKKLILSTNLKILQLTADIISSSFPSIPPPPGFIPPPAGF